MSNVTSRPIPRRIDVSAVVIGLVAVASGLPGWLAGSRYTLDGILVGVNLFLAWLNAPPAVQSPTGWSRLVGIALVGVVYSYVEVGCRPGRRSSALSWVIWSIVIVTDVGSTLLGVVTAPGDWPLAQWIAGNLWIAGLWSIFLTFWPEWAITGGWAKVRDAWRI